MHTSLSSRLSFVLFVFFNCIRYKYFLKKVLVMNNYVVKCIVLFSALNQSIISNEEYFSEISEVNLVLIHIFCYVLKMSISNLADIFIDYLLWISSHLHSLNSWLWPYSSTVENINLFIIFTNLIKERWYYLPAENIRFLWHLSTAWCMFRLMLFICFRQFYVSLFVYMYDHTSQSSSGRN